MITRLIFVRHAEAAGNVKREFHGWTDEEITEKGHIQAQKVAERLKDMKIDVLYSSSMKRTLQTASYISKTKNLPIIRTDKLKEINGGDWEGIKWDDLPSIWPEAHDTWENKPHLHQMPNGESMEEFQKRLIDEVLHIAKEHMEKNICVVTHGTAIRAMMCSFMHCSLDTMREIEWYDNTSVTVIDYEDGRFKVIQKGDASHLGKELSTVQNQEWWVEYKKNFDERTRNL